MLPSLVLYIQSCAIFSAVWLNNDMPSSNGEIWLLICMGERKYNHSHKQDAIRDMQFQFCVIVLL